MTDKFTLTDDLKLSIIGRIGTPVIFEIEKCHIQRFAKAIQDPNPLWNRDEALAPPTFLRAANSTFPDVPELSPLKQILDGSSEWEYLEAVSAGDVITANCRIANVRQRTLSIGIAVFIQTETTYRNQSFRIVAIQRSTMILY